jgi:hypothetical protein
MKEDDEGIQFHTLPLGCIVAIEFRGRSRAGGSVLFLGCTSIHGGSRRGKGVQEEGATLGKAGTCRGATASNGARTRPAAAPFVHMAVP